jgi:tetratricopeptide (TPR) repeat protein
MKWIFIFFIGVFFNANAQLSEADNLVQAGVKKASKKDYSGAIIDYNNAIIIAPTYYVAYVNRGNAKKNLGKISEAMQDFNIAIKMQPKCLIAIYNRGLLKHELGDYRGAISDLTYGIDLEAINVMCEIPLSHLYNQRGMAEGMLNNLKNAFNDFNIAIRLDPLHELAYYNRGIVRFKLGDKEGACLDWSKAGELGLIEAYDNIKKKCK